MSLSATVNAMVASGCTAEQIAAVVFAYEAEREKEAERRPRSSAAIRQKRYRDRLDEREAITVNNDAEAATIVTAVVTGVTSDVTGVTTVTGDGAEAKKETSPTPPKEKTNNLQEGTLTGSQESSLFPDAPVVDLSAEKREKLRIVGEWWNELADSVGLPTISKIAPGSPREKSALARCREISDDFGTLEAGLAEIAAKIRGSPLMLGKKGEWKASFDFVTGPKNYLKIIEGNYDEVRQASRR